MTDVPTISITQDENDDNEMDDDSSPKLNINDCHTDVEDLDSEPDRNQLILGLKKNAQCNGAVTDVEDYDDSDDNEEEPERDYGPEISLNEYLDQGTVDECANATNKGKGKLIKMQSITRAPSPSAFSLGVTHDTGGVTDLEDLEASGDENDENEKVYSDDDKAIVLEDFGAVDIQDAITNSKKPEKCAPKIMIPSSSSSSESEEEKPKMRLKTQKHFTKRAPKCSDAKSDVENIFFSDDDKRKPRQKSTPVLETPDIEVMAFDGSDHDDAAEPQFPEINITFAFEDKPKKKNKYRGTPAPSPMLRLPQNQDEGHTDVENLNSSDDDEEEQNVKTRPKCLIPIALIKSDALTDVEDLSDASDDDCDLDDKPDVPLPSPVRELTVLVENKNGEPTKQTMTLPDNMLLGFLDLDADKGLTDVEDFSDESADGEDDHAPDYDFECIPDYEGGVVESSDHTTAKRNSLAAMGATPEPKTDTEDIFVKRQEKGNECRRRRTKTKHSQHKTKSNFLDTQLYVDANASGAHTDVEDLDVEDDNVLLKDKSLKQRRSMIENVPSAATSNNADGKTDSEYMSADENLDLRFTPDIKPSLSDFQLDSCTVTRSCDTVETNKKTFLEFNFLDIRNFAENCQASTDVEDDQCNSENEDAAYSRAQTATPMELNRDFQDLCSSEIHEINSGAFDRVKEHFEIKENLCLAESHTDIENFDDDGLP